MGAGVRTAVEAQSTLELDGLCRVALEALRGQHRTDFFLEKGIARGLPSFGEGARSADGNQSRQRVSEKLETATVHTITNQRGAEKLEFWTPDVKRLGAPAAPETVRTRTGVGE